MSNAIIYTRVSTKNQAEEGYSLAGQEKDCKTFAEMNGYKVSKVFVEKGESAKTQDRTELQNLMKFCIANKKNIDAIIELICEKYPMSWKTYFRKKEKAIQVLSTILWGYTSKECLHILSEFL